jgi:hypothetical protein
VLDCITNMPFIMGASILEHAMLQHASCLMRLMRLLTNMQAKPLANQSTNKTSTPSNP